MWIVFCWKETIHCLQYRRIHTLKYSFPVRQYQLGFQITWCILYKKKLQSSCGLWAQTKMEAQKRRKRWASNLMKCNKCLIACTRKVQLLLHLQSQHIEHQKKKNDLSKKSHKTFCQYFADEQIDGLKQRTTWQLSLHRKIQIPGMI